MEEHVRGRTNRMGCGGRKNSRVILSLLKNVRVCLCVYIGI